MQGPDIVENGEVANAPPLPHPSTQRARGLRSLLDQTFELEMLISGAVLFLAFQLPAWLDGLIDTVLRRPDGSAALVSLLSMGKGIVFVFILNQLLHLLIRMMWVGCVGLKAQYPEGPDASKLKRASQSSRAFLIARYGDLQVAQDRLEGLARLFFSIAIIFTVILLNSVLLAGAGFGIHTLLSLLVPKQAIPVFLPVVVLSMLPGVAILLDRLLEQPRLQRFRRPWLDRLIRPFATSTFLPGVHLIMPMMLTISTRMNRWAYGLLLAIYLLVFSVAGLGELIWKATTRFFPNATGPVTYTAFYESEQQPGDIRYRGPILHTPVLSNGERYLQVFLPLDGELLDSLAPAHPILEAVGRPTFRTTQPGDSLALIMARDACLNAYAMAVDGKPLPLAAFRWYRHPRLGMDGLQAYLAVDTLAPGMHILRSQRPFRKPLVWEIPFYR